MVVVYKIDRLSRSLMDFSKLVEIFDRAGVTFVSRHPVVQHHDLDGAAHAQHPALLRPVRARGHRRAGARQDQGVAAEGHLDGRQRALRLPGREPQAGRDRARRHHGAHDLRAVRPDRLGDGAGAGAAGRGPPHPARQAGRQGLALSPAEQPDLPRALGAQGHGPSGRARGDHRPGPLGQGARDPRRERPHPLGAHPGADAGAAEGADSSGRPARRCRRRTPARATGSTATTSARTC